MEYVPKGIAVINGKLENLIELLMMKELVLKHHV